MSILPQELCDSIISFSDQPSLAACSLVCRNWVPSSRIKLFATLRPLVISPSTLAETLQLVDTSLTTISPYILSLVLKDWAEVTTLVASSFYALLPRLTGRMVAVKSMTFHATDWEEMEQGALKFLVLVALACSFPALEALSIRRLVRLDAKGTEMQTLSPQALESLRSIHVLGFIKKELFRWIMAIKRLNIEAVTLGPLLPGEARVVGKFLKALKNNLKHITLSGESTPSQSFPVLLR
ncbi:hypothetical protein B0H10DRAFT_2037289 [Mycena sp. CBHHK59/15]|nr:hypothetical protein B0H10DRAFT_2037289 [Mycena sp. CBHHK59/15]